MVFQAFAVWPHMTVYDNVAFPLKLKNISAQVNEKRTTDALRHTNLLSVPRKALMIYLVAENNVWLLLEH